MKNQITIKFASYALADLLYNLLNSGIDNIVVTKEDNELEIVITMEQLSLIKWPLKKPVDPEGYCGIPKDDIPHPVSGKDLEK